MTPEEEDRRGMDDALERARAKGGADTFGVVSSLDDSGDDSDNTPDGGGEMVLPEMDLSKPDAPDDGDTAPPTPAAPDANSPAALARPVAPVEVPDPKPDIANALRGITSRRYTPPASLSDDAINSARDEHKKQVQHDNLSRAISAWLMRKPYEPESMPDESAGMLAQRREGEASFDRETQRQLTAQQLLSKALRGDKSPPAITPYQQEELGLRKQQIAATAQQRAGALADRKRTMLSLYPEHKAEIDALGDLGDAQTLQTALEGRMGREQTQQHSDTAAAAASQRELAKQIDFEKWKQSHQNLTAEQKTQLEGIEKSDEVLNTFEKGLSSVSGMGGKLAARVPGVSGALGASGAEFPATREGTAIGLARGLEGGTARPGNVEIIQHMLPEASDADSVKAAKMRTIREFVKNNRNAFMRAAQQAGAEVHQLAPQAGGGIKTRKTKSGGTAYSVSGEPGTWYSSEEEARGH